MTNRASRGRRWFSWFMAGLTLICVLLALAPLVSLLYDSAVQGGGSLNLAFFTKTSPPPCNPSAGVACQPGGIASAIEGTLAVVGLASLISLPTGLLTGIYLSEYGNNRSGRTIRFFVDVMTGVPSIVVGIVTYMLFLYAAKVGWIPSTQIYSAFAASVAIAILMIPIIGRTCDEALRLVPTTTREAALALGIPKYRATLRIVLTTGRAAVATGVLLGVARAAGETAPLIMTIGGSNLFFRGYNQWSNAIPLVIYQDGLSGYPNLISLAWGAALVLVLMMLGLSVATRLILRTSAVGGGSP